MSSDYYVPALCLVNGDGLAFTFTEAKTHCESKGGKHASLAELKVAFDRGFTCCAYSWLSDGLGYMALKNRMDAMNNCDTYLCKTPPGQPTCLGQHTTTHSQKLAGTYCLFEKYGEQDQIYHYYALI